MTVQTSDFDDSELWRMARASRKAVRDAREQTFQIHLEALIPQLESEGIGVRLLNQGMQLRLERGDWLANFYPRSGKFHFQKPKVTQTISISFEEAVVRFRRRTADKL